LKKEGLKNKKIIRFKLFIYIEDKPKDMLHNEKNNNISYLNPVLNGIALVSHQYI